MNRASASLARRLTLLELVRASDAVIVGTALASSSRWEKVAGRRRIVSYTRTRADESWAGNAPAEIIVRTLGGRVGDTGEIVHGEAVLLIGEPAVLFVSPALGDSVRVTGMSQGHYPLRRDDRGILRLSASPRGFELDGADPHELLRATVDEARTRIQKAWHAR
jgi:hypothetical protein